MARSKKQEEHAGYGELPGHLSGDVHVYVGRRHGMTLSGAQAVAEVTGGAKADGGKDPWDLLPWEAVRGVVQILAFGANKYGRRNWEKGIAYGRVYAAAQRHLTAWWQGEDTDAETGFSHLAHASCCTLFLLAFVLRGRGELDDRPSKGAA